MDEVYEVSTLTWLDMPSISNSTLLAASTALMLLGDGGPADQVGHLRFSRYPWLGGEGACTCRLHESPHIGSAAPGVPGAGDPSTLDVAEKLAALDTEAQPCVASARS